MSILQSISNRTPPAAATAEQLNDQRLSLSSTFAGQLHSHPSAWRWCIPPLSPSSAIKRHKFSFYTGYSPLVTTAPVSIPLPDATATWITDACPSHPDNLEFLATTCATRDNLILAQKHDSKPKTLSFPTPVFSVVNSPGGEIYVGGCGQLYKFSLSRFSCLQAPVSILPANTFESRDRRVTCLNLLRPGRIAFRTPADHALHAHDLATGQSVWTIDAIASYAPSHHGNSIATTLASSCNTHAFSGNVCCIWDSRSLPPKSRSDWASRVLGVPTQTVTTAMAWTPFSDHQLWTVGSEVSLWDTRFTHGPLLGFNPSHRAKVTHVAIASHGTSYFITTGSFDGSTHIHWADRHSVMPMGSFQGPGPIAYMGASVPNTLDFGIVYCCGGPVHKIAVSDSTLIELQGVCPINQTHWSPHSQNQTVLLPAPTSTTSNAQILESNNDIAPSVLGLDDSVTLYIRSRTASARTSRHSSVTSPPCLQSRQGIIETLGSAQQEMDLVIKNSPTISVVSVHDVPCSISLAVSTKDAELAISLIPALLLGLDLNLIALPSVKSLRQLVILVLKYRYVAGLELGMRLLEWATSNGYLNEALVPTPTSVSGSSLKRRSNAFRRRSLCATKPPLSVKSEHEEWATMAHWLILPSVYDTDPVLDEERRQAIAEIKAKEDVMDAFLFGGGKSGATQVISTRNSSGDVPVTEQNPSSSVPARRGSLQTTRQDSGLDLSNIEQELNKSSNVQTWSSTEEARKSLAATEKRARQALMGVLTNGSQILPMIRASLSVHRAIEGPSGECEAERIVWAVRSGGTRTICGTVIRAYLHALDVLGDRWDEYLYTVVEIVSMYDGYDFSTMLIRHFRASVVLKMNEWARMSSVYGTSDTTVLVHAGRIARYVRNTSVLNHDVEALVNWFSRCAMSAVGGIQSGQSVARALNELANVVPPYVRKSGSLLQLNTVMHPRVYGEIVGAMQGHLSSKV